MKFKHKLVQSNTPRELTYVGTSVMENEQVHENRKSKKDDGKIATVFRYYESREMTHYHVLSAVEIRCLCFDCPDTVARKYVAFAWRSTADSSGLTLHSADSALCAARA